MKIPDDLRSHLVMKIGVLYKTDMEAIVRHCAIFARDYPAPIQGRIPLDIYRGILAEFGLTDEQSAKE